MTHDNTMLVQFDDEGMEAIKPAAKAANAGNNPCESCYSDKMCYS
jgi:hypothetical protein